MPGDTDEHRSVLLVRRQIHGPQIDPVRVMMVLMGLAVLAGLARTLATLNLTLAFSNEGWTAYHAADAASGRALYPAPGGLVYNNYPPLGYYLIGGLGRLIGDTILAGRILSVAAFVGIALGIRKAVLLMGAGWREAGFAALIFAGTMLFDYDFVGVNDPQLIAHAVQIAGLVLLLRQPRTTGSVALAAVLFVLALFIKHALIALPLVTGFWLLATDRRNGLKFAAFGVALVLAGAALFQAAYGRPLLAEIHDARVYWLYFAAHAMGGRAIIFLPLIASIVVWRHTVADKHIVFCVSYAVVSVLLAAYFLGGAGTGGKMLFDAIIALSLCAGVCLHRLRDSKSWVSTTLYAACQFVPVVAYVVFRTLTGGLPHHWVARDAVAVTQTRQDIAFLKAQDGAVLCGEPALCFWAGKPFEVDLWGYQQAVAVNARDGHELMDAIASRRYAVLQLAAPPHALGEPMEADPVWSRRVAEAIMANYRIHHTSFNGTFWVPRVPVSGH